MSQEQQHLTAEQLSAYIDTQLSATEQEQVDEHLKQCEQCQLRLGDLCQTVALLRTLPQPQLPRSFALPADVLVTPFPSQEQRESHTSTNRRIRGTRILTALQAISALAAIVGIVFLLSAITPRSFSSTSTSSASSSSAASQQVPQAATRDAIVTATSQYAQNLATPSVNSSESAEHPQIVPAPAAPPPTSPLDPGLPGGRAVIGITLFLLGIICVIILALQRRRLKHTTS